MVANFEAHTLPLLFAAEDAMRCYFATMKLKLPRKAGVFEASLALCLEARHCRNLGNPLTCCQKLHEAAMLRRDVFPAADHQRVAAFEHCIWTCIHLGVVEQSEHHYANAQSLFLEALRYIRLVKVDHTAEIPFTVMNVLELALHHNWANYWVTREKWNAAQQHASVALGKLKKLDPDQKMPEVHRLLQLRHVMARERLGDKLSELRAELSTIRFSDTAEVLTSSDAVAVVNAVTLEFSGENSASSISITLCLHSSDAAKSWDSSLGASCVFLFLFTKALLSVRQRDYPTAVHALEKLNQSQIANPVWKDRTQELLALSLHGSSHDRVVALATPKDVTRYKEGLDTQHLVKQYLLAQEARRERLKQQSTRKKHLLEEDPDANLEEIQDKWKILPSDVERKGLLVDHPELSQLLPHLETSWTAAKKCDFEVFSRPQELARTLASLRTTSRPTTTECDITTPTVEVTNHVQHGRRAETAPLPNITQSSRAESPLPPPTRLTHRAKKHIQQASNLYETKKSLNLSAPTSTATPPSPIAKAAEADDAMIDSVLLEMEVGEAFLLHTKQREVDEQSKKVKDLKKALAASKTDCVFLAMLADVERAAGSAYDETKDKELSILQDSPKQVLNISSPNVHFSLKQQKSPHQARESPPPATKSEVAQRQELLRSMLPRIDFRSSSYREVVRELVEIEKIQHASREDRRLKELEEHAVKVAHRRSSTRGLLEAGSFSRHAHNESPVLKCETPSERIATTIACGLALLFSDAARQPSAMTQLTPPQ